MAAVRGLRVSVKAEAPAGPALGLPSPEAGLDRGEPEPMEVEEGELEVVPVRRSLKELIPVRAGGGGEEEVAERVSRARASRKGRRPGRGEIWGGGEVWGGGHRGERPGGGGARLEQSRRSERKDARKWVLRGLEEEGSERLG